MSTRLGLVCFLLWQLGRAAWAAGTDSNLFLTEPGNLTVEVGSRASFAASFASEQECDNVHWVFSDSDRDCQTGSFQTLGTCTSPTYSAMMNTSRYSLTFSEETTTEFQISRVVHRDAGLYFCAIGNPSVHSRCAHLTVVDPLKPTCSASPTSADVGESVNLTCRVPVAARAPSKLRWEGMGIAQFKPGDKLQIVHTLSEADNFRPYTCTAGAGDVHTRKSCTVYPLQVNVSIAVVLVRAESDPASNLTELTFECRVRAVPAATNRTWDVALVGEGSQVVTRNTSQQDPQWRDVEDQGADYQLTEAGRLLTITNINSDGSDELQLLLRCTASNTIGMQATSQPVTVTQCSHSGEWVTDTAKCGRKSSSEAGSIVGVVVIEVIALLSVLSVIGHVVLIRWEKTKLRRRLEQSEIEMQSMDP